MQKGWIAALIVVFSVIAVSIYFYVNHGNSKTLEIRYPDGTTETVKANDRSCQMVGWQNKVGLSFTFDVLKKYQGTGGFNLDANQVRQLDDLQNDFGLQFETLCKDYLNGVYKGRDALYDCRRSNVGNALTTLRQLKVTLEPIKSMQDAAAQKDTVTTALDNYYRTSANNFSKDCNGRALNVDRTELRFGEQVNQQTVSISNGGYFDMTWEAINTPHNFICDPRSHQIHPSSNDTLVVYRLHGNADDKLQTLTVRDNFNEAAELKIIVDDGIAATARLITDIKDQIAAAPNTDATAATLATVKKSYPSAPEGVVNWVSGELLDRLGKPGEAKSVLQKAAKDPALSQQPQFKLDLGTVLVKTGDRDQSKLLLDDVSRHKDRFYAAQADMVMRQPAPSVADSQFAEVTPAATGSAKGKLADHLKFGEQVKIKDHIDLSSEKKSSIPK